jgi:hypothetical protein
MQPKIIDSTADCTVQMFMDCCYRNKYQCLLIEGTATDEELKAVFELIYAQWIDESGLYQSAEYEKYAYISSLETRNFTIERFVMTQKEFINQFGLPYIPGFEIVKKYGHKLFYNPESPDIDLFLKKLDQVYSKESRYRQELKTKSSELVEMRAKKKNNEHSLLQNRKSFISMITKLQQNGYVVEKKSTVMEEVSVMLVDSKAAAEEIKARQNNQNYK